MGYEGPQQLILGENRLSAPNDPSLIPKDIEKCVFTRQILRFKTLPAKYIASPLGLAPKHDGPWKRIHH